jgi:hypothetical protein
MAFPDTSLAYLGTVAFRQSHSGVVRYSDIENDKPGYFPIEGTPTFMALEAIGLTGLVAR